jgi:hypothetical protein
MTSSWFFLSTLNYDTRSTTHQNDVFSVCSVMCCQVDVSALGRALVQRSLLTAVPRIVSSEVHTPLTVCCAIKKNM